MRTPLSTLTLCVLKVPTATQSVADHAPVTTLFQGQTQLLDVDLTTGAFVVLPWFPSDGHAPLAVAVDPVDGRAIVAIDRGGHGEAAAHQRGEALFRRVGVQVELSRCDGDHERVVARPAEDGRVDPDAQTPLPQSSRDVLLCAVPKISWAASAAKTRVTQQFATTVLCLGGNIAMSGTAVEAKSNQATGAPTLGASAPICNR